LAALNYTVQVYTHTCINTNLQIITTHFKFKLQHTSSLCKIGPLVCATLTDTNTCFFFFPELRVEGFVLLMLPS